MAQSDQTVQNATFPAVRADINDNLAALYSQSSGNSAPTTTVAFQPWVDTSSSPPVYKIRNATNSGWITIGVLDTNFEVGGITPIANGGTGETTASAAINALVPSQTGNAGKFLGTDGTALSWLVAASGASVQVFTSSGTYTPTASKTSYVVFVIGGGGGSGGATSSYRSGGGGGSGCGFRIYNNTELGSSAAVTVGAGGSAGTVNFSVTTAGGTGGTSSFAPTGTGVTLSATGGGGTNGASSSSSDGGNAGGSTNSQTGGVGQEGFYGDSGRKHGSGQYSGGNPGSSVMFGRGKGGRGVNGSNGLAGDSGIVVILEF